ncbi:MAG TPA: hypothetical protein VL551_32245 [Actinospica sp.]|nr:hypothetical protein [Actinospica sp.]
MSDSSEDEQVQPQPQQAQNLKRPATSDKGPNTKRQRVDPPVAGNTPAGPPAQQPAQTVQTAQVGQATRVAPPVASGQPVVQAALPAPRQVIGVSVMPPGLDLEIRRYVNKWSCFAIDAAGAPATTGEPKWITERRRLYTGADRLSPDVGQRVPGAQPPKRGVKVTQDSAKDSVNVAAGAATMTEIPRSGFWAVQGLASGPVPKGGRRDLQLLNQLSQLLLNEVAKSQEIEAMVVNGRILVSANEQGTVDELAAFNLNALLPRYRSTARVGPKQTRGTVDWKTVKPRKIADLCTALLLDGPGFAVVNNNAAAKVGLRRLIQLQVDCQLVPDQRRQVTEILATLHATLTRGGALVNGGSPAAAAAKILDPAHAGKIITVDAVNGSHAEQNLVAAVIAAAVAAPGQTGLRAKIVARGPVSVAGGKRPCTTCWFTIGLARRYGLDIHCNWHPGGLWKTTTNIGAADVATLLNMTKEQLGAAFAEVKQQFGGYTQYVSDARADAQRSTPVAVKQAAQGSEYGTNYDSLSDSEDNDTQVLPELPTVYNQFQPAMSQPYLNPDPEPVPGTAEEPMETVDDPSASVSQGSVVVPGAVPIAFDDIPGAVPDSTTTSASDPALTEDDAAGLDEDEPFSSYQVDDDDAPVSLYPDGAPSNDL